MFYTNKDKAALKHHLECLYRDIRYLQDKLEIQDTRINALMKAYPNGINKDGSPRKKMGRKVKEQA